MPDRDKVMQWLETCVSGCEEGCPYEYKNLVYRVECKADLMSEALAILREQEAVEPGEQEETRTWIVCGNCSQHLIGKWLWCPYCGRKVKWDAAD